MSNKPTFKNRVNMLIFHSPKNYQVLKSIQPYEKKCTENGRLNVDRLIDGMMKRVVLSPTEETKKKYGRFTHIIFYDNHSANYPQEKLRAYDNRTGQLQLTYPVAGAVHQGAYSKTEQQ